MNRFIPSASAAISRSLIAENALPILDREIFFTPMPNKIQRTNEKKYITSFFSIIRFPNVNPDSKSTPRKVSFAAFLPNPAPPVINFKFEKKCEPMNTSASVTKPKFNPFRRAETGDRIIPIKVAARPESGSQITMSSSYPITLVVATPPSTEDT